MKTISGNDFFKYWKNFSEGGAAAVSTDTTTEVSTDITTENTVKEIINAIRANGDKAVRHYASLYDRSSPENPEVPLEKIIEAVKNIESHDIVLSDALKLSAQNILRFSQKQREQFVDFEFENSPGIFTGQKVIPVKRAAVYVPGGRFPLVSSALMCLIPAFCAGVEEVCFASPPGGGSIPANTGAPDTRILAAAGIAAQVCGRLDSGFRAFSMGGAQAIAALALGTETVPRCDVVSGPGNKYVAAAKRLLFGETGIDFIAGPSDILVIMDESASLDLAAADMLAQAEHDPDARARALVPNELTAKNLVKALDSRLQKLSTAKTARQSLDNGGLIVVYENQEQAQNIANIIAPEHLELQTAAPDNWIASLKNFGSLFIGSLSAEVLGDYSAGLNHTLPTLGTSRFSSGLSVRYFLKTLTTLRCEKAPGFSDALKAAETIAVAEGLSAHAQSAAARL